MTVSILGIPIASTSYETAVADILRWARQAESRIVCAANVHMLMEAFDSSEFAKVVKSADLVTPDGMPLVWMMRLRGVRRQERVYGPTLMMKVIDAAARQGVPVGLYGSTPQALGLLIESLRDKCPGLTVAYSFSPPFGPLSPDEDRQVVEDLNRSGARILFVGLGCPKQERWMAEHRDRIDAVMIGVGAAFDFHAGRISQAPRWIQTLGLEWLFRLAVEPRRLWRRYLYHNPRFVILAIADLLGLLR
jgi:N-acetylglucosaminyldiphosphoundecaprenol N-acetyl-beta-D-mannosaminyltransferase